MLDQREVPRQGPAGAGPLGVKCGAGVVGIKSPLLVLSWPGSWERALPTSEGDPDGGGGGSPLPWLSFPTWLYCPLGTPPPLGEHMSVGLVTQSRTHWVGREPSTAGSRVRLIGEAIGYGVGRGRGQAGILGPPSSLPPLLEEPTSKALSACRQPSHSRPAAARPGKPLAGVDWAWSRTWRAFRTPPEDPRIMLETHRQE